MKDNQLVSLSKQLAVEIINLCSNLRDSKKSSVLTNQLLRCGTSIGANVREGNYASSRQDFINKFQIALKECYETEYWLELFVETNIITQNEYSFLINSCNKIRRLLVASINTAKACQ
ncbi:MAG: four helix bundle protein [Clostridia bacterium]|nr:four helix bundle protein [Clostridia bacterium]